VLLDCRFSLSNPNAGRLAYDEGHIAGAHYADLARQLSSPVVPGSTGRHPLPDPEQLAKLFGLWGVTPGAQVVAYDDANGAMAARAWWLLRWLGHDDVAVLDGGISAWVEAGAELSPEIPTLAISTFELQMRPSLLVDAATIPEVLSQGRLFDARALARFRGEHEPIDPVAGHIPGARPLPFEGNSKGTRFLSQAELRQRYAEALGGAEPQRCAVYCGSGVTACHDILAAAHAGYDGLRLYAGSWSEWVTDPSRAVATGD
jgi:thiosulfate/3-mercaptopyruvate sulfurtransferase